MKAGIIAAGEGSRLKAEGIAIPKPLVEIEGVSLIERLILSFLRHGITEIVCIVNEDSLRVKTFVEQKEFPIPVRFVVKTTPSSMHSLLELAPHLNDGRFLLSTVDSVFHDDEFARYLRQASGRNSVDGVLAVTKYIDDENPLYVEMDDAYRIRSFSKSARSEWVTGGLYVLSPRIFTEVERIQTTGIGRLRNFFGHLLETDYALEGFPFSKIIDVDHVHDIHVAEELLRPH